jgi:hypothetical protein
MRLPSRGFPLLCLLTLRDERRAQHGPENLGGGAWKFRNRDLREMSRHDIHSCGRVGVVTHRFPESALPSNDAREARPS